MDLILVHRQGRCPTFFIFILHNILNVHNIYGLFSKGASKMGYFLKDKNDISSYKLANIFILFNSKQTEEAGRVKVN